MDGTVSSSTTTGPDDVDFQVEPIDSVHTSDCFYSDYVLELVTTVFSTTSSSYADQYEGVLNPGNLTLNLPYLDCVLNQLLATRDVSYNPECTAEMRDYLQQIVPVIGSVFRQFDQIYKSDNTAQLLISLIEPNLYWTGNWKRHFIDSIDIALNTEKKLFGLNFPEEQNVRNILALSIITSGIEQTLGNLVLTQSHFVPPLLKTLLTMPELEALIDIRLTRLLKVIVGPPITINLRNILWHGFVNCTDRFISPSTNAAIDMDLLHFFYLLLAISASIGAELQKKPALQMLNIQDDSVDVTELKARIVACIPHRKLYNFDEFASRLAPIFPTVDLELVNDFLRNLVMQSPLIHRTLRPLWFAAFRLLSDRQNHYSFYSFCLLMPLLESSLRYLYCSLNQLSNRLLTAICHEYYVTFTEILAFHTMAGESPGEENDVIGEVNRLFDLFPRPLMLQLLDIILLPEGLRFRDRLSHGQVALHSLNSTIANYVVCSIIAVHQLANSTLHPSFSNSMIPEVIQTITGKCILQYECLYHPVYQLKTQLKALTRHWLQFVGLSKSLVDEQYAQYETILEARLTTIDSINHDLFEPYIATCDQLVLLLRNCTTNYERFTVNLHTFLQIRSKELKQCKLRSRQRSNYQTMLNSVPLYLQTFCAEDSLYWNTMLRMLANLRETTNRWCAKSASLEKILKRLLKCAQNLAQQSTITENHWDIVAKLCTNQQTECLELVCQRLA